MPPFQAQKSTFAQEILATIEKAKELFKDNQWNNPTSTVWAHVSPRLMLAQESCVKDQKLSVVLIAIKTPKGLGLTALNKRTENGRITYIDPMIKGKTYSSIAQFLEENHSNSIGILTMEVKHEYLSKKEKPH